MRTGVALFGALLLTLVGSASLRAEAPAPLAAERVSAQAAAADAPAVSGSSRAASNQAPQAAAPQERDRKNVFMMLLLRGAASLGHFGSLGR